MQEVYKFDRNNRNGGNGKKMGMGSILLLIILILVFTGIPQKVAHEYKAYQDKKVKDFLEVGKAYIIFTRDDVHLLMERSPNFKQADIHRLLMDNRDYKDQISKLKPPSGFVTYHELLLTSIIQLENILLMTSDIASNPNNILKMNEAVQEANTTKVQYIEELKSGLDKREIPYKILEDGTIEYYIIVRDELELSL